MQLIFFLALAVLAVAGAAGVVLSKNPVYSALSLLLNFAVLAVMYILLQAQFLAVVQVIVYAGAIVVLFLFVVMLIGADVRLLEARGRGRMIATYGALAAAVVMLVGFGYLLVTGVLASVSGAVPGNGSVQAIGEVLFTEYLLPFELASVLLLVAMIGAVVLARKT
jgi:NADH-quinone oxidoreductase subunit J